MLKYDAKGSVGLVFYANNSPSEDCDNAKFAIKLAPI